MAEQFLHDAQVGPPPSSRCVAALCRSPCGPMSGGAVDRGDRLVHDGAHLPWVEPPRAPSSRAAPEPATASEGRPSDSHADSEAWAGSP